MKKNYLTLFSAKIRRLNMKFRKLYFQSSGLSLGSNTLLGTIKCDWPNKVIIGNNCEIQDNVFFRIQRPFNEYNWIKIGTRVFVGNDCEFNAGSLISIGDDCLIAPRTIIVDAWHETRLDSRINQQKVFHDEIIIEEDVWVGTNCKILKGVRIGRGSVIGAGSVVNKSIPPYQIWAGVPARFIKNR